MIYCQHGIQADSPSVNDIYKDHLDRLTDISRRIARKIKLIMHIHAERREFGMLSELALKDIGIEPVYF